MTNNLLHSLYYDTRNPASFSGKYALYRAAKAINKKITLKQVSDWLHTSDTYTRHFKGRRRPRTTNKWVASGINTHWMIDLADFGAWKEYNKNYRYVLVICDVLSRQLSTVSLKTKKASETAAAFKEVLFRHETFPSVVIHDDGSEFKAEFKQLLDVCHIKSKIPLNTDVKSCLAENSIARIRNKLQKYFTSNNTYNWIDCIDKIVESLNATHMDSIGMAPKDVSLVNEKDVKQRLYGKISPIQPKFKINDKVRILRLKSVFSKGSEARFTTEHYTVSRIVYKQAIPVYMLSDTLGQELKAFFYSSDLVLYNKQDDVYQVESILGQRRNKGTKYLLCRFKGYPPQFDLWLPEKDVFSIESK